jgi:hypothetical protein
VGKEYAGFRPTNCRSIKRHCDQTWVSRPKPVSESNCGLASMTVPAVTISAKIATHVVSDGFGFLIHYHDDRCLWQKRICNEKRPRGSGISGDGIAATDPASASPNRTIVYFAICAFAGVRTVCRQSRGKLCRKRDREGRRLSCLCPTEFAHKAFRSSAEFAHKTRSKIEPAQRFGSNDVDQLAPSRVGSNTR